MRLHLREPKAQIGNSFLRAGEGAQSQPSSRNRPMTGGFLNVTPRCREKSEQIIRGLAFHLPH